MRWERAALAAGLLGALSAGCQSAPLMTLTFPSAAFATSGANVFNCNTPAQPATTRGLSLGGIRCDPTRVGTDFSGTPVTDVYQLGCGDGHAATLFVSCWAGDGGAGAFAGTVFLGINPTCDPSDGGEPSNASGFVFDALEPGASVTQSLTSCAAFGDFCTANDPCAFNSLSASVTVTNQDVQHSR